MRPVQKFTSEYLENCRKMKPEEILEFLENFRRLTSSAQERPTKSKLISLKVPEDLLESFKLKAEASGQRYQTLIKKLMLEWVQGG